MDSRFCTPLSPFFVSVHSFGSLNSAHSAAKRWIGRLRTGVSKLSAYFSTITVSSVLGYSGIYWNLYAENFRSCCLWKSQELLYLKFHLMMNPTLLCVPISENTNNMKTLFNIHASAQNWPSALSFIFNTYSSSLCKKRSGRRIYLS